MHKSFIYVDESNSRSGIDLIDVVRQIYVNAEYEVYGMGLQVENQCIDGYFDVWIQAKEIDRDDIRNIVNCIEELHHIHRFDSILIPATMLGRMLAPRLAMRLGVGLVADVTSIGHHKGSVEMVRPAFDGRIYAGIIGSHGLPMMMSVRPNVFHYKDEPNRATEHIDFHSSATRNYGIKRLNVRRKEKTQDIQGSEVLVCGGGGVMKDFACLTLLADELDGMVAASRRVVDSGVASRQIQVGQSGKTVSPKLYIALGIYGAVHHIEGLKNVEHMICVNTNKDAPICSLADIVVEGDAGEFVHRLVKKMQEEKLNKHNK